MSLLLFEMPTDAGERAAWLECQLTGPEFSRLLTELVAVHVGKEVAPTIDELLDGKRAQVLRDGLACLTGPQLHRLTRYPDRLLELQELVCVEGGPYWDELFAGAESNRRGVEQVRRGLAMALESARPAKAARRRSAAIPMAAIAIVASLLIGFFASQSLAPRPFAFLQPLERAPTATAQEYLRFLADAFDQRLPGLEKADAASLPRSVDELLAGCAVLLATQHPHEDRWLHDRCAIWAGKFVTARAQLEEGKDVAAARKLAIQAGTDLVKALRDHADELSKKKVA